MGIHHIKKLLLPNVNSHDQVYLAACSGYANCDDTSNDSLPPPPPPLRPYSEDSIPPPYFDSKSNLPISKILLVLFCFLAALVVLVCFLIILRKHRLNRRRANSPNLDQTNEEFIDEDHGPEVIHHVWLINTIGLQQSVIDSISIFKYKKDEVLIEGTDCSVCLSEFQEDESLRLLPKCNHAFHIPCIDTWLRSHTNCPLCRAPVVVDTNNVDVNASSAERNLDGLSSTQDNLVDNLENSVELGSDQAGEDGENVGALALPIEQGNVSENSDKSCRYFSARNFDVRVQSDLADHIVKMEGESQQRRRSISMDSSSASLIHFAAADIRSIGVEGYSKKVDSSKVVRKGITSNSGIFGMMKSSSFRRYSEKRPISMRRSFSSSGKWSKQRSGRGQDSILPF